MTQIDELSTAPPWHKLKTAFTKTAMQPIKAWLIVIPFVAGFVSLFPIEIADFVTIGGDFKPPFSFTLSYFAAVLYMKL